jgi:hypothetical protein
VDDPTPAEETKQSNQIHVCQGSPEQQGNTDGIIDKREPRKEGNK